MIDDDAPDDTPTARRRASTGGSLSLPIGARRVAYLRALPHATPAAALAAIWPTVPGTSAPARLPGVAATAPTPCPPVPADAAGGEQVWLRETTLPPGMFAILREWGGLDPHGIVGIVRAVVDAHAARGGK